MERGLKELHKEAEEAEVKVQVKVQVIEETSLQNVEVKESKTEAVIPISDIVESVESCTSDLKVSDIKSEHTEAVKSDSVIKSEGSSERDSEVRVVCETNEPVKIRKKRRRKRKNMPSTTSKLKSDSGTGHVADLEEGDIFEMEDLSSDEEMSRLTSGMSTSISLPVVEESKLERTNEWASAHESFYMNPHPFSDTDLSPLGR